MNAEKTLGYRPIITHDIDRYYKWKQFKSIFGETSRIIRNESSWSLGEAWGSFLKSRQADPFSNLIEIAEMDQKLGLESVFYIMTTEEKHPKNINDYNVQNPKVKTTLRQLLRLGCEIGLHPGILTYNDEIRLIAQKERLEKSIDQEVVRSRQHYLKYKYPDTFKKLETVGIKNDSSILVNLAEEQNPRKRTTYLMRDSDGEEMNISQTPLVFMDTHHMDKTDDEILTFLEKSVAPAKKEGGEIMILWHNNNISNSREKGLYKEALEIISN
ncbi:MAG: hypothetical protein AAGA77_00760 [Bacteroidota bacterium]